MYHCKFKAGGVVHQRSLKTGDFEEATRRAARLVATTKQIASAKGTIVDTGT